MEFHISRQARDRYQFDESIFSLSGNVILANFHAARIFAQKMNQRRDLVRFPEQAVKAGQINALGLIDEILHLVVGSYRQQKNPEVMGQALDWLYDRLGQEAVDAALQRFTERISAGGRLSPAIDHRRLPGRRDRRHAQSPGRPGRDADAVAGQRQSGLRALL